MDNSQNKYTLEDLNIMQAWPLDRKIQVTQTRIIEWYERWGGYVYVSFSGGKDSTVLLDLVRRTYPDVPAVFLDTGLEYPEVREFVKTIDNVVWLKPKLNFRQIIEKYGYPVISKEISEYIPIAKRNPDGKIAQKFRPGSDYHKKYGDKWFNMKARYAYLLDAPFEISNRCCKIMKKDPAKAYEKETGRKPIIASMACESQIRKNGWIRHGCNAFDVKRPRSSPLSFWTESDILEYLCRFKIPYAKLYGEIEQCKDGTYCNTGLPRTGCVFCGFGCQVEKEPNRFQRLKQTHPKLWDYCMRPWDKGGLGMKEVLEYIGVKYE